MKKAKTVKAVKLESQRCLLALIGLAIFIVIVGVVAVGVVYADDLGSGPNSLWPGEGGGNTPPNTIEGYVWNRKTQTLAGPGLNVYLYYGYVYGQTTTDVHGYFKFEYIWNSNTAYTLMVNGNGYNLGKACDDMRWGQWSGIIITDDRCYGFRHIYLEPATVVTVPAAALFSNTKYASLRYGIETTSSFSHSLSFKVVNFGVGTGYTTSTSVSYVFGCEPLRQFYVGKYHYAATYWNDMFGEILYSGIAGSEPQWDWGGLLTHEYIDPNSLSPNSYKEFPLDPGLFKEATYTETGSYKWSATLGVPFAMVYPAFGNILNLDTTVTTTSGATNKLYYIVDRRGDTNPNTLMFRVYTAGVIYDDVRKEGGMELHIWDMSGGG